MQVNTFLSSFLHLKMDKEMLKYSEIEKAFQKIKAATVFHQLTIEKIHYFLKGISEAGEIVHKFLNRESTYSHLLSSIEEYERNIDGTKRKNEELK